MFSCFAQSPTYLLSVPMCQCSRILYMGLHDVFLLNYVILVFLMGFLMVPVYMGAT
jgi:hypothetical protein